MSSRSFENVDEKEQRQDTGTAVSSEVGVASGAE
jgi:hypothetical protein